MQIELVGAAGTSSETPTSICEVRASRFASGNDTLIWFWATSRDGNDHEPVAGPVILPGM
jgi:hypothetical protein